MKQGMDIEQLAAELKRQLESKRDFKAPTKDLRMEVHQKAAQPRQFESRLRINGFGDFGVGRIAHEQLGQHLKIPKVYYDRMLEEQPVLLTDNVNTWLGQEKSVRLVRTLYGQARSFHSDRYRPLDNFDLAEAILPEFPRKGLELESQALTESRLYLKATSPSLKAEVRPGQVFAWGVIVSNSEVGMGALSITGFTKELACLNGAVHEAALRRHHVGKGSGELEDAVEFYSDATRKADDSAFWMKVRDTLKWVVEGKQFEQIVGRMKDAAGRSIDAPVPKTVEVISRRLNLNESEGKGVLDALIRGGKLDQLGLHSAVTRAAQDVESYDRATELERLGGKLLEYTDADWQSVNKEAIAA